MRYAALVADLNRLLESARRVAARSVNTVMTATYWEFGRRLVEFEQGGERRAGYGEVLLERLAADLKLMGRGFSVTNLKNFRTFYLYWPIQQRVSAESGSTGVIGIRQTPSGECPGAQESRFLLPWSHYVRLMAVKDEAARHFYECEALRGGWSVRQLDRQIAALFYERTLLSKNKSRMLTKGARADVEDRVSAEDEIKDPLVLEFLDLKDEYSENDLEEALLFHLERFLMELGGDFAFIGRQRRLRIGEVWYRVDLLFFHRRLRALLVIDLKIGAFGHADAGQMQVYLNYARDHWMLTGENPPVGLILCSQRDDALAKYALHGLPNQVLAREYQLALPRAKTLQEELAKTRTRLEDNRRMECGRQVE